MQTETTRATFSYAAIALGALAVMTALVHAFAGPFAPTPSIEVTVGEIAANIRAAAERALAGAPQPEPVAAAWNIDRLLEIAAPLAGVGGVVLAIIGFVRHEPKRAVACGMVLGASAIMVQMFFWAVMMVCAVLLLTAIIGNIGEILGDFGA